VILSPALAILLSAVPAPAGQDAASPVQTTLEASGHHYRLNTDRGAVHVWEPRGYDAQTAGAVIYLHGYYTNADQAWNEANLPGQFEASARNALFIVPESPDSTNQQVQWPDLGTLLDVVREWAPVATPRGPLVVVGHSGAFRTIVSWLRDTRVQDVVLLDGLYRDERLFYWWILNAPQHATHRLTLVAVETLLKAQNFARHLARVPVLSEVPSDYGDFTPAETRSRVLLIKSHYEHMELVNSQKVIPVLLQLPPLSPLPGESRGLATSAGRR
jgi:hypothetical protein